MKNFMKSRKNPIQRCVERKSNGYTTKFMNPVHITFEKYSEKPSIWMKNKEKFYDNSKKIIKFELPKNQINLKKKY